MLQKEETGQLKTEKQEKKYRGVFVYYSVTERKPIDVNEGHIITINVPVVYMVRYKVVLRGDYP